MQADMKWHVPACCYCFLTTTPNEKCTFIYVKALEKNLNNVG